MTAESRGTFYIHLLLGLRGYFAICLSLPLPGMFLFALAKHRHYGFIDMAKTHYSSERHLLGSLIKGCVLPPDGFDILSAEA
jgi:hypothetical protein